MATIGHQFFDQLVRKWSASGYEVVTQLSSSSYHLGTLLDRLGTLQDPLGTLLDHLVTSPDHSIPYQIIW